MPQKKIKVRIGTDIIKTKKVYRQWLSREDWGAEPPQGPVEKAEGPVTRVYFHYRSGTPPCYTTEECCATMRKIQDNHFRRRMGDIAFNFLVASGGNIYDGRGYGILPPADLRKAGPPGDRIDIAFVGDWTEKSLPYVIFKGGMAIVDRGLDQGHISLDWMFHAVMLEKKPRREDLMQRKTKQKLKIKLVDTIKESIEEVITFD